MHLKFFILLMSVIISCKSYGTETPSNLPNNNTNNGKVTVTPISQKKYAGEAPYYDEISESLFWLDLSQSGINRWDSRTNRIYNAYISSNYAVFLMPVKDRSHNYVIGNGGKISLICWDRYSKNISSIQTLYELNNQNNWILDDSDINGNNLFLVTYPPFTPATQNLPTSPVYAVKDEKAFSLTTVKGFPNGVRWSINEKNCFFISNTDTRQLLKYTFSPKNNTVGKPEVLFDFQAHNITEGMPDSFTLDEYGHVWLAVFGGGKIIVINDRTGALIRTFEIGKPPLGVTNCIFGGKDYSVLYVTTSYLTEAQKNVPGGGLVYRVDGLGVRGARPNRNFIDLPKFAPSNFQPNRCDG